MKTPGFGRRNEVEKEENLLPFPETEPIIYIFSFPWFSPEVEGLKEPALPLRAKPGTFRDCAPGRGMKRQDYIEETERYYPELLRVIREQPEYNNAAWLLKYQIRSLLLTAKRITV